MSKLKPCERIMNFTIPAGLSVLDSAFALSQQNRMAFRQGMEYAYDGLEIFAPDPTAEGLVQIYRIPQTWVSANSWVKAFSVWRDQRRDAMAESNTWSSEAKYADFKIYYNVGHQSGDLDGTAVETIIPNSFLTSAQAAAIDADAKIEWGYSTFVVPNLDGSVGITEEYYGGLLGADSGVYKSLIVAYAESRARPFPIDPSNVTVPSPGGGVEGLQGGLYAEMSDVGEDMVEIQEGIRDQNDSPPYVVGGVDSTHEFYPWGENQGSNKGNLVDHLIIRTGATIATDATGPFSAYCGLLFFSNGTETSIQARLKFSPGPYKGVMARPMQEVN